MLTRRTGNSAQAVRGMYSRFHALLKARDTIKTCTAA